MFDKLKKLLQKKKAETGGLELPAPGNVATTSDPNGMPNLQMANLPPQPQSMTPEEQKKLLEQRKKIPMYVIILKFLSLLSITLSITVWAALSADLNEDNKILKFFGLENNTETNFTELTKKQKELQKKLEEHNKKTTEYEKRIKESDFTIYKKQIEAIESEQYQWFDEVIDEKNSLLGIIDSIDRMKTYLTKSDYENEKNIHFILNDIEVNSQNFNRVSTNLNVRVANVSHNSLALATEFIEMMNSFPFFKGASISSFTRKENNKGEMETTFSIKLDIQGKNEIDSADKRFEEYTDWFAKESKKRANKKSPRRK